MQCLACGAEGSVLCHECMELAGEPVVPRCAGCHELSEGSKICKSCRSWIDVYAIYIATNYSGIYGQIVRSLKFDMHRQSVVPMATLMREVMEINKLPKDTIVCPLPTAPTRIRQRGFDHTKLLSREFMKTMKNYEFRELLGRKSNVRQLGSSRAMRIEQMQNEFFVKNPKQVEGKTILLLDDVITTGATMSSASNVLKKAGAKRVYGVVFAQKV